MTSIFQDSDLLALRDAVAQLGRAIAVSDLASVERATVAIQGLMDRNITTDPAIAASQKALLEEVFASSEALEALLASRLRAFDIAIAAWREPDPGR